MKLRSTDLPRIAALAFAILMVGGGVLVCRLSGPAAPQAKASAQTREPPPLPASLPEVSPQGESGTAAAAAPLESANQTPSPTAEPKAAAPKPKRAAVTRRPLPPASLPPFPPDLYSSGVAVKGPSGPPPGVLWLSGIIQGTPKLALLRRDEKRYLVREGDIIENRYRVVQIASNSVTLQRGSRKSTLRLGQY